MKQGITLAGISTAVELYIAFKLFKQLHVFAFFTFLMKYIILKKNLRRSPNAQLYKMASRFKLVKAK